MRLKDKNFKNPFKIFFFHFRNGFWQDHNLRGEYESSSIWEDECVVLFGKLFSTVSKSALTTHKEMELKHTKGNIIAKRMYF